MIRKFMLSGLILLIACTSPAITPVSADPAPPAAGLAQLRQMQDTFASIADAVAPSVVAIQARRKLSTMDEFDADDPMHRRFGDRAIPTAGSGVIIDPAGLILTNEHVVASADELVVVLSNRRRHVAKIISSDPRSDLAVIKIDAKGLPVARFGDIASVRQGHWAIAMGNPFGLASDGKPAMTIGIVSAIGRALPHFGQNSDRHYGNLIQTSAEINPGNSGGPLLNLDGQVIGINTAISTRSGVSEGVGFAVPITARTNEIIAQLKAGQKVEYGFLGVVVRSPDPQESTQAGAPEYLGAIVDAVEAGTPADTAKLRPGDVIVQVDEDTIEDSDHLVRAIGGSPIGRTLPLVLWREKKKITVQVVLQKRSEMMARRTTPEPVATINWRGLSLGPISDGRRKELGRTRDAGGIEVLSVVKGSPGEAAGIKAGDVIERLADRPVVSMQDLRRAIVPRDAARDVVVQLAGGVNKTVKPEKN